MTRGRIVYAVSDSTGETAEQAARAALAQFDRGLAATVILFSHVRDEPGIQAVVRQARENDAFIVYTLAEPDLRARMATLAPEEGVVAIDVLGKLIWELSLYLEAPPLHLPGLGHETDEAYFRRIEAMEFAVTHDDGRNPKDLKFADLVIVGVSRTSKTPLSNYIAHRGFKVANIPLVRELEPPAQLEDVDPRRVFALVIDPGVLRNIRRARLNAIGADTDDRYGDLWNVQQEIRWCRSYIRAHPDWTVVDTTEKAIEETAATILTTWQASFEMPKGLSPRQRPKRKKKATAKPAGAGRARKGETPKEKRANAGTTKATPAREKAAPKKPSKKKVVEKKATRKKSRQKKGAKS